MNRIKISAASFACDLATVIKNKFIPFKNNSIPINIDNICFLLKSIKIPIELIKREVCMRIENNLFDLLSKF